MIIFLEFVFDVFDHLFSRTSYDSTKFKKLLLSQKTTILSLKTELSAIDLASFILETSLQL